jgi:hypothetical protein
MIATARGVLVLAIIAVVLAILVVIVGPAQPSAVDRTILAAEPTELVVMRQGEPPVTLVKRGNEWRWREPDVRADPATVDGILTALRARWHRTGTPAGKRHGSLRVGTATIEIGESLAGTEQTWIIRGDRAFLVDNWIARALVPSRVALRVRQPFTGAGTVIEADDVRVEGTHRITPTAAWIDPAVVAQFHAAAAAVDIIALEGQRGAPGLDVAIDGRRVTRIGSCGSRTLIATPDGEGCVDTEMWKELEAAARALRDAPPDKRPVPVTPTTITFADGTVLGRDADRDRVDELITALQTPGELAPRKGTPTGKLVVGDITLELFADGVARAGEPMMIRTPHIATIARPSSAYRDSTRWREDAMTIQSISVDGKTFTRGAVLGEWTGAKEPALVEALAATLAIVRAPSISAVPAAAHHISVTFVPPTGAPSTHTIEIGARCAGRIDGQPAMVPADLCSAALALH